MSEETITKQSGEIFCHSCGAAIKKEAEICPKCGVRQNTGYSEKENWNKGVSNSKWSLLFYLSFFLGWFGVDRFYVGKIGSGIFKLITIGGLGLWWLIDFISVATGKFTDFQNCRVSVKNGKKHWGILAIAVFALLVFSAMQGGRHSGTDTVAIQRQKPVPIDSLTANELLNVYKNNEVSADNAYKGEYIKVSGRIDNLGKDILDEPYITLKTGEYEFRSIQVYFRDGNEEVGRLSKGQKVTIIGKCSGLSMNVLIKDAWVEE